MNTLSSAKLPKTRHKLGFIEAGRGIAALAVVLFHADTIIHQNSRSQTWDQTTYFSFGERGVDFFFVLSGFIIVFAHSRDTESFNSFLRYCLKRIIRIYPLVFAVAFSVIALNIVIDGERPEIALLTSSFLLTPSLEWPMPSVSWSLRHEILFYMLFSFALLSRQIGLVVLGVWFILCVAQAGLIAFGAPLNGITAMVLSPLHIDFAIGACVAALYLRFSGTRFELSLTIIASGLAALALITAFSSGFSQREVLDYTSKSNLIGDLAFGLAFAPCVLALAFLDKYIRAPQLLVHLGAASFAIYLIHTSAMGLAAKLFVPGLESIQNGKIVAYLSLVLLSIVAGWIINQYFETPTTKQLRKHMLGSRVKAT